MKPPPVAFVVEVEGLGNATCWRAEAQEYADCMFSAGLAEGVAPDTIYVRVEGRGEPLTLFLRPDEALAIARVIIGALWTADMFKRHPEDVPAPEVARG
jgi:hypothetical protein